MVSDKALVRPFQKGNISKEKGVWQYVIGLGGQSIKVSCPMCGAVMGLDGHTIDEDEKNLVRPSLKCGACGLFYGFARLINYRREDP